MMGNGDDDGDGDGDGEGDDDGGDVSTKSWRPCDLPFQMYFGVRMVVL